MQRSNTNNNLITALYCRLSQEDMRIGESMSIENQRLMLTEYAEKNGFKNIKLYIDDGFSGTDNTRPAYVEMLEDVKNGLVSTVIVKDQSRLGRDHLETDRLMELIFPAYEVRFIAITDGVDSANGFNEMSGIRNLFNDMYARDTSKKIRAVQRAKGERGERVGGHIPYGYMKDASDNKKIVPDPETAPIVKRIFEMYAHGLGFIRICDILSKEKVLSPSMYEFRKTGSRSGNPNPDKPYHWAQATVRKMLLNRVYCGDTVNFKTYTKSNKLKKRLNNTPENILIFKDTHKPIVDRLTFDLVQKHFEGRKRPDKRGELDMFAGYLYCADCGARMNLRKGEINNYSCSGHSKRGTDCTSAHYIRATEVERVVLSALQKVTSYARENSDKFYEQAMQRGEEESKKLLRDVEKQQTELNSRIKQLDNIIATLYEDRVIGRLSPERYDQLSAKYEEEQTEIKAKLEEISQTIDRQKLRESCIRSFIQSANRYIDMPKLTPELLRTFIKRIEIHEKGQRFSRSCGNRLDIYFTFSIESGMIIDGTASSYETTLLAS
ncbi:MAG: recombinase family protein [Ruminococcus sp.]|nr:recombinase family protein [Ruminococcus sp.]